MKIRINKYLSKCEIGSRRKIESLLWGKEISVNGVIANPGQMIDSAKDKIMWKSKLLKETQESIYIMLNKPAGIVSTTNDELNRKNILSLIPKQKERLYPIGRLDKESTGLIILTNDGDLTLKLTHPRYHLPKTYQVSTIEDINDEQIKKMSGGMRLPGGRAFPCTINRKGKNLFEIILNQGMKRQIREMCELVGLTVDKLHRTKIGTLDIGELKIGGYRNLEHDEIEMLKKSVVEGSRLD